MKKNGFTFIEIFTALIVIMIISGMCISSFKTRTNNQKLRLFAYASIVNLMKGNISAMDNNSSEIEKANVDDKDWLCLQIADAFALKGSADCAVKSAGDTTVNLTMANGVTVQGLSTPWIEVGGGFSKFKYKDIMIDIDGAKGLNKLYVDRIPLRILSGSKYTGIVQAINCGSYDNVYLKDQTKKSPYCPEGKNVDYISDDSIITYDIYRQDKKDSTNASMVASSQSTLKADCSAYGTEGIYDKNSCNTKGFNINLRCLTADNCALCSTYPNICKDSDGNNMDETKCKELAAANNPDNLQCFTLIHRPNAALGMILDTVVGKEIY